LAFSEKNRPFGKNFGFFEKKGRVKKNGMIDGK